MTEKAYLIADVGGTNARFAIIPLEAEDKARVQFYKVREIPTFSEALTRFMTEYGDGIEIISAAFAIAGPVFSDRVKLTNSDWVCDKLELKTILKTQEISLFNDGEAVALAIPDLSPEQITVLQHGEKRLQHPSLILSVGTGLAAAALIIENDGTLHSLATESGHTRYAPTNEQERKIVNILANEMGDVTTEYLVSGPGLVNLYRANCHLIKTECNLSEPAEILTGARNKDALCQNVIDQFAALFGNFASQMSLSWGALGGIYLTGGVLEKLGDKFNHRLFIERMTTNPRMVHLLHQIPVFRINAEVPAFTGLSAYLQKRRSRRSE
ncbi:MAG: ROK family protein [Alphaproteobacteria bacterium]|nr:ROK family protein [Alphaproteobacteria bacterium]